MNLQYISRLSKLENIITLNGSRLSKHCDVCSLAYFSSSFFSHLVFIKQKEAFKVRNCTLNERNTFITQCLILNILKWVLEVQFFINAVHCLFCLCFLIFIKPFRAKLVAFMSVANEVCIFVIFSISLLYGLDLGLNFTT